ncbi:hypothetical protein AWE77_02330 [Escherichia coli]|nr:hypothetical protein AWE77_02330 [Escherichia coli]
MTGYLYVRQDIEGRAQWFHVTQLLNGRSQGERVYSAGQRNAPPAKPGFHGSRRDERRKV